MKKNFDTISFHGSESQLIQDLHTVFERAGITNQETSESKIAEGHSILVISNSGDINYYKSELSKMAEGSKQGTLTNGFIWNPNEKSNHSENFEGEISSYLSRNINYSREPFIIRFAEDVIKTLETRTEDSKSNGTTNMSVFYSVLDSELGKDVVTMMSDIFTVNDVPVDISDPTSTIDSLSKLATDALVTVVIFDKQKEWAELFTQEIWKKIGGVSAGIPIILIGVDSTNKSNLSIPNVTIAEASRELLALELKIQYDSLVQ